ncbi:hypothetical protein F4813DRAFT_385546 [Daldinia decipiens]|uniref:uncharacterized protein n=1 Tax=Daldinia decipiens TaxID=326647 RepID=UPI0020C2515B|nr:uncharacterized protein F4813DRAFT_385546 [Daldinia decipiens]KAI1661875.1 hypothetical protein F4813DRAFT_385546 [Daldinia decipiens]
MSVAALTLRQRGWRLLTTILAPRAYQHRSTSWVAWEQPNPALYTPPHAAPSSASRQATSNSQGTRNVREAGTIPETATIVTRSQEISTSGKIPPPSIQANASRIPYSHTRSIQTRSDNTPLLPTTLLRIPGVAATWPGEAPKHPDQPRVRKHAR